MTYDVGCGGAWGVLVTAENVGDLHERLVTAIADWDPIDAAGLENEEAVLEPFCSEVAAALAARGVAAPSGPSLFYCDGADAPGRIATDPGSIIFGFSMWMKPWEWPPVPASFAAVADLHTWVWGG